ncbi:hypothetical protein K8I85_07830 [bacterium]|nr:hypothetical protein [bacterium]
MTCYLLHFAEPVGHAQHYVGQTARADVMIRVGEHRAGRGARLTRVAASRGIEIMLARVWENAPRCFEQKLKNRGGLRRLCPVCRELAAQLWQGSETSGLASGRRAPDAPCPPPPLVCD